ncbi:tRNA (N6-threonylcarbamoyladenosine(37)-N6)-methyltransferase TrmO [Chloroflexota bacterium]
MSICMEAIGCVINNIDSPRDYGWAKVESRIIIREHLSPVLSGLSGFSHILVIFWMHQAEPPTALKRSPQGRDDMPEVGLLAQRSKHRPNPIGVTAVQLIKVCGCELIVRGLDAINGTPVLDIKPYYSHYDRIDEIRMPEWVDRLMKDYF